MFESQSDDHAIRLEAGRWVMDQAAMRGGEVAWKLLQGGFRFRDEIVCLITQRGIHKPSHMELPLSITTSPKNPYRDSIDPATGLLNYRYFGTDPYHRDNEGLRRLRREQHPLIYFHGLSTGRYLPLWPVYVVGDDPERLTCTVAVDHAAVVEHSLTDPRGASGVAEARELERRYATREAIVRLHQGVFRHRVLPAYRNCCAFCQLRKEPLLDAAHIVPDSDPTGDPVVPNGMALCKIHHAAFDQLFVGVTPRGVVEVRPDVLEESDGPMLRHGLQDLHGHAIHRPRREADQPDPDRLNVRYQQFKKAS